MADKKSVDKKKSAVIEINSEEDRRKALDNTLAQLEKTFGKGAIMRLGENTGMNVDAISTGSISLDIALGIGGVPRGRIIEIYGPEASGKTTLALHVVAAAQKNGGEAAYIDAEHALDPEYAQHLGVDIDELLVSQPDNGEQALDIAEMLVRSGALDVIVIDSVAALVPRAEIEGEMGDSFVGLQARLMSQALRKLAGIIAKTNCVVIFINQLREKIGGMGYGPSETTTGGRALKFYSSVRIDIRRIDFIKNGDENIGNHIRAKIVKNKIAPPFRTAEFDIMYGTGINYCAELIDLGVQIGEVAKSGSWYSLNGERIGQGRDRAVEYVKNHPETAKMLDEKIRQKYNPNKADEIVKAVSEPIAPVKEFNIDIGAEDFDLPE